MANDAYKGTIYDKIHPGKVILWASPVHFLFLLITFGISAWEINDLGSVQHCQTGAAVALTLVSMVLTVSAAVYSLMSKHALPMRWYAILLYFLYWTLSICAFSVVLSSQDRCFKDVSDEAAISQRKLLVSADAIRQRGKAATAFAAMGVIETFAQLCLFVWFAVVWFTRPASLSSV